MRCIRKYCIFFDSNESQAIQLYGQAVASVEARDLSSPYATALNTQGDWRAKDNTHYSLGKMNDKTRIPRTQITEQAKIKSQIADADSPQMMRRASSPRSPSLQRNLWLPFCALHPVDCPDEDSPRIMGLSSSGQSPSMKREHQILDMRTLVTEEYPGAPFVSGAGKSLLPSEVKVNLLYPSDTKEQD